MASDDSPQTRPFVPFLEPCDVVDDSRGAGFDTPMIAVYGRVPADLGVVEAARFLLGDEQRNVGVERALIALQSQHIIGLFVEDGLGNRALAPSADLSNDAAHRRNLGPASPIASMVTMAPSIAIIASSLGMAVISFDFSSTLTWPSTSR
jgi:hypothetical protein